MKAIVTRKNKYGEYPECGMNDIIVTNEYKLQRNLVKYGIPSHFRGKVRVEIFYGSVLGDSVKTFFVTRWPEI